MRVTGNNIWSLNCDINKKVGQRAMERVMLGNTKKDRIPNNTIRQRTKVKEVVDHITRMKWKCASHMARTSNDRWPKRISEWRSREDKRNRGRPLALWSDDIRIIAGSWIMTA